MINRRGTLLASTPSNKNTWKCKLCLHCFSQLLLRSSAGVFRCEHINASQPVLTNPSCYQKKKNDDSCEMERFVETLLWQHAWTLITFLYGQVLDYGWAVVFLSKRFNGIRATTIFPCGLLIGCFSVSRYAPATYIVLLHLADRALRTSLFVNGNSQSPY